MKRLIPVTLILTIALMASPALGHHRQSVGWNQGYSHAVDCTNNPTNPYPRYKILIKIADPQDFYDAEAAGDITLHAFLNARVGTTQEQVIHWDQTEYVDAIQFPKTFAIQYFLTFPYPKTRLKTAWVNYGDRKTDVGQLTATQCTNTLQWLPSEGEVGPKH